MGITRIFLCIKGFPYLFVFLVKLIVFFFLFFPAGQG